jgi:hypothetical protein
MSVHRRRLRFDQNAAWQGNQYLFQIDTGQPGLPPTGILYVIYCCWMICATLACLRTSSMSVGRKEGEQAKGSLRVLCGGLPPTFTIQRQEGVHDTALLYFCIIQSFIDILQQPCTSVVISLWLALLVIGLRGMCRRWQNREPRSRQSN